MIFCFIFLIFFDFFYIIQINASVSMSRYRKIIPIGVKYKQVDVRGGKNLGNIRIAVRMMGLLKGVEFVFFCDRIEQDGV